jgi:trans-aconitate methyltransferase
MWSSGMVAAQQFGPLTHARYRLMRKELQGRVRPDWRLIDIGCGNGKFLTTISDLIPIGNLFGVELSPEAMRSARDDIRPNLRVGDILDFAGELAEQPFDGLVSSEVLEHVDDPPAIVGAFHKILKPGALVVITVPAQMRYWSAQDVMAGHQRRFEFADFEKLMSDCGFKVEECFGWGGGPIAQVYNRMVSAVGPDRVRKSGTSPLVRGLSAVISAGLRLEDLYKTRRGFQLVCRARRQ